MKTEDQFMETKEQFVEIKELEINKPVFKERLEKTEERFQEIGKGLISQNK